MTKLSSGAWTDQVLVALNASGTSALAIQFVVDNTPTLIEMGQASFTALCTALQAGNVEQATEIATGSMNATDIIAQVKKDSVEMDADTARRAQFIQDLKVIGLEVAPILLKAVLAVATGGVAI